MNEHDNNHVAVAFLCLFKKEGYTGCSRALRCVGGRKKKTQQLCFEGIRVGLPAVGRLFAVTFLSASPSSSQQLQRADLLPWVADEQHYYLRRNHGINMAHNRSYFFEGKLWHSAPLLRAASSHFTRTQPPDSCLPRQIFWVLWWYT